MKIELSGVGKQFQTRKGRINALAEVDLTIEDGEFFILLGPSGCGKSTLLNLLAGLERPGSGEIRFDGKLVAAARGGAWVSPRKRDVAMVFQSYALYPHLSAFENIAFPLRVAGMDRKEADTAVRDIAATLQIGRYLDARPGELSGGQRQRVAIARALVRKPRLFLLDEPLSNLDAQLRAETRVELKSLQRELGVTTVYVTHDQVEAMTLGRRIAVLRKGRIEQVGNAEDLYLRPANPFIGRFIGAPQMNLLEAEWKKEGRKVKLQLAGQELTLAEADTGAFAGLEPGACLAGWRPEHLSFAGEENLLSLRGRAGLSEPLGREYLVHVKLDGAGLTVLTTDAPPGEGEEVRIRPVPGRLHVFQSADRSMP
ncbi:MAG: ABC transporter ATP-binding protein [Thermodesulfobacteriota bacterium]